MVSFQKLLITFAFFITITTTSPLASVVKSHQSENSSIKGTVPTIVKRTPGHQLLQWSTDGTVLYLIGTLGPALGIVPPELLGLIRAGSEATPAQILLRTFTTYVERNLLPGAIDLVIFRQLFDPDEVNHGAVHGISILGSPQTYWGFAFSFITNPPNQVDLRGLITAIETFARQGGGAIMTIQRPNGFFNTALIQAGVDIIRKRTRNGYCPAPINMLKHATADVPQDLDYGHVLRWSEPCLQK